MPTTICKRLKTFQVVQKLCFKKRKKETKSGIFGRHPSIQNLSFQLFYSFSMGARRVQKSKKRFWNSHDRQRTFKREGLEKKLLCVGISFAVRPPWKPETDEETQWWAFKVKPSLWLKFMPLKEFMSVKKKY